MLSRIPFVLCQRVTFKLPFRSLCDIRTDLTSDLSRRQVASLKKMERKIVQEQERVRSYKLRNIYTGLALAALVLSICK